MDQRWKNHQKLGIQLPEVFFIVGFFRKFHEKLLIFLRLKGTRKIEGKVYKTAVKPTMMH